MKWTSRRGAEIVEASFVMLFFLALIFLLLDLCWGVWVKTTLQHAVREGCRYAITSQTIGASGQLDSVKQTVQRQAMGLLNEAADYNKIFVRFYRPDNQQQVSGVGSNNGGNLVVVSVENYQVAPFFPLLRGSTPLSFTVRAGDKMEASPGGIAPPL